MNVKLKDAIRNATQQATIDGEERIPVVDEAGSGVTEYITVDQLVTAVGGALGSSSATTQSGTTYTVDADDSRTTVRFTNASAVTVTIPTGLAVGSEFLLYAEGAGGISLTTTGNTLTGSSPSVGVAQNEAIYVEVVAADTLMILGGTA